MSILDKARALESRIAEALSRAAGNAVGPSDREPLEIVHAIVDAVDHQIQSGSRGARVFPFNRVAVSVLAPSRDVRARLDAVLSDKPSLQERLIERLRCDGCEVADLHVDVAYVSRPSPSWRDPQFHLTFDRVAAPTPVAAEGTLARIEITVARGDAEPRSSTHDAQRIDIGRGGEVRDRRNRLLRTNHIAFVEGAAGENLTVSRCHAHVAVEGASGDLRLYDDGSEHGTGIIRDGRTIPVPPGSRGVRIRSGDEIALGEARVRIRIVSGGGVAGPESR